MKISDYFYYYYYFSSSNSLQDTKTVRYWCAEFFFPNFFFIWGLQDELEAELEELEGAELEEQLLQPAISAPAAPVRVPAGSQPARPAPQKISAEEDELAALQAEMAL